MTTEQRQDYKTNGYYDNACYNIAKAVFLRLYKAGERRCKIIEEEALNQMRTYCKAQGWNAAVTNYHIKRYGIKSLMYWFTQYDTVLIT